MIWAILNTLRIDHVGWLGNFSSVLQVATFIMFAAALLLFCPSYNSSSFVFFNYYNGTGYENRAYVLVISILTTVWGFAGIDANAHMAEESVAAQVSTPHSIIIAVISNAVLGFAFILVVLFCIQDYDTVINSECIFVPFLLLPLIILVYPALS